MRHRYRECLFIARWTRAENNDANDTRAIIQRLVEIRAQQAKLLGFPITRMENCRPDGKNAGSCTDFMRAIVPAARGVRAMNKPKSRRLSIRRRGDLTRGWDWAFYAEQVRRRNLLWMRRSSNLLCP
ncbi:M3 family metallopeptidase [Shigella flexneri]